MQCIQTLIVYRLSSIQKQSTKNIAPPPAPPPPPPPPPPSSPPRPVPHTHGRGPGVEGVRYRTTDNIPQIGFRKAFFFRQKLFWKCSFCTIITYPNALQSKFVLAFKISNPKWKLQKPFGCFPRRRPPSILSGNGSIKKNYFRAAMQSGFSDDGSDDESFGSSAAGGLAAPANGEGVHRTTTLAGLSDFEGEGAAAQVASDKSLPAFCAICDMWHVMLSLSRVCVAVHHAPLLQGHRLTQDSVPATPPPQELFGRTSDSQAASAVFDRESSVDNDNDDGDVVAIAALCNSAAVETEDEADSRSDQSSVDDASHVAASPQLPDTSMLASEDDDVQQLLLKVRRIPPPAPARAM
jgi:cation transport regulator ChaB